MFGVIQDSSPWVETTCSPCSSVTSSTGIVVPLISACIDRSCRLGRLGRVRCYRHEPTRRPDAGRGGWMSDSRQYHSGRAGIVDDVSMSMDDEQRYQAAVSKDSRFDGVFFIAVTSTGIYCRPSCPAITPKRANMRFYRSAAAAQEAGFRACKRCRPDASPGSPEWNIRADVVGRAMRLIADGVVDRDGVAGLAERLGYEQRQVRRLVTAELGAGPLAIARAQRAQTARVLTETTTLPLSEIAFAAGFASIRQFNATIQEVFAVTPTLLRERRGRSRGKASRGGQGEVPRRTRGVRRGAVLAAPGTDPLAPGLIRLRLPYRVPVDLDRMLGFLAARAIPGVESVEAGRYRRTLMLPNGTGIMSVGAGADAGKGDPGYIDCELQLEDLRDLTAAVQRCRRLLDLDADPEAVTGYLGGDPVIGPLARACPGRRSPGHVDGNELALRAVLGQQVSVAAARRLGARLVAAYGKPLERTEGALTHCFPAAETLAAADPATLPMPRSRAAALTGLAAALASGELSLDPGAERDRAEAQLLALPGIGPWTAAYIRMRALSDPDAFLPGDAGVLAALGRLGAVPDRNRRGGGACAAARRAGAARPGRPRSWPKAGGRGGPTPSITCGLRWRNWRNRRDQPVRGAGPERPAPVPYRQLAHRPAAADRRRARPDRAVDAGRRPPLGPGRGRAGAEPGDVRRGGGAARGVLRRRPQGVHRAAGAVRDPVPAGGVDPADQDPVREHGQLR